MELKYYDVMVLAGDELISHIIDFDAEVTLEEVHGMVEGMVYRRYGAEAYFIIQEIKKEEAVTRGGEFF